MIEVGQTIGNYKITAKLGEGGMGVVYLGEHPLIGKKVALKAIHPELSRNNEVISRFMTEARAVNQIGHEHIVDIVDFGNTAAGDFYFIMELLQGESLAERLKRDGRLEPSRALAIVAQIADALAASHGHGIIHRDLKPENIFLVPRAGNKDFVKVLDFGLAKLTQGNEPISHKTRTGLVMGTPYYMSPEQCEGKSEVDHRADVYSLGVLLFEMLTGKVPFGGEGYGEIIVKHITMPPPSVRSIVPDLLPSFDLILFRALAKDRAQRFQSMSELRDAMLDPAGYAHAAPTIGIPEDLSGVIRAATPMARSEMALRPPLTGASDGASVSDASGATPSTFRQGVGEIIEDLTPKKRTSRVVLFVALAGLTGIVAVSLSSRHEQKAQQHAAAGGPTLPAHPSFVRVNFNSDPDGAAVIDANGRMLGLTPLSIQVPYRDSAVEYVFKKQGFEPKTMYIVPNLPSPLFATLQAVPPPKPPTTTDTSATSSSSSSGSEGGGDSLRTHRHRDRDRDRGARQLIDDDAVLEPSFR
jgi:serine/threonine-protein kinase